MKPFSIQFSQAFVLYLDAQQYLMVLGGPGAGKSTFLRQIGLEALKGKNGNYKHSRMPVFIELKAFRDRNIDLLQAIIRELRICGFPDPENTAQKFLDKGKLLLLLDGLDEVSTDLRIEVINTIEDFVDRYDGNSFICSCRIAAHKTSFKRFTDVEIADFEDRQIKGFIGNWFSNPRDKEVGMAGRCWNQLQQSDYKRARELAQTPLLLTFLCLTFDAYQTISKRRAELYNQALDVLLRRWAAEKRIQQDPVYKDLSLQLEELMLAEIAYSSFLDNHLFFHRREVSDQIKLFLSENLNAPKHLDSSNVLQEIEIQQGILVERDSGILSFSHLTLQEYLTAQHIKSHDLLEHLVFNYLTDERWREVFLLVAELVPSADKLLKLMEKQTWLILDLKSSSRLEQLIAWSVRVTNGSSGDYHPVSKRAIMVAHAYAFAYVYNRPRTVLTSAGTNRIRDLDRSFDLFLHHARSCACVFDPSLDVDLTTNLNHVRTHAFDLVRALARETDLDRAIALAFTLERLKLLKNINFRQLIIYLESMKKAVPTKSENSQIRRNFSDTIWLHWLDTLGLDKKWLTLADKEVQALNHYLYVCELMASCKDTAVRISSDVWNAIEERMLTLTAPPR